MTKPSTTATQRSLREVIADDSHALTFQTSGQYRAALLKHQPMQHTPHTEAFAWAVFAKDDNVIIWSKNRAQVESAAKEYGRPIVPVIALFAAEQGAAPVPSTHCDPAQGFCAKCREQERSALANQPAPTVPAGDARVEYVPIATGSRAAAGGAHPNDNTPADASCQTALDKRGDDRGQGLDPYWKWGFRAGWHAGRAHQPAQEQAEPTLTPAQMHADELHAMLQRVRKVDEQAGYRTDLTDAVAALLEKIAQQEPVAAPQQAPIQAAYDILIETCRGAAHALVAVRDMVTCPEDVAFIDRALANPQLLAQQAAAPKPAHGHRDDYYLLANGRRLGLEPISRVRNMPNWVLAMELFATGSTSAHQLCRDAGVDPDSTTTQRATQLDCSEGENA